MTGIGMAGETPMVLNWGTLNIWFNIPLKKIFNLQASQKQIEFKEKNLFHNYSPEEMHHFLSQSSILSYYLYLIFFILTGVSLPLFLLLATTSLGILLLATENLLEGRASSMCMRWVITVFPESRNVSVSSLDLDSLYVRYRGSHFWHKWHFCLWHHITLAYSFSSTSSIPVANKCVYSTVTR